MPNYSLLFARTAADADISISGWGWDKIGDLGHHEYRRPDTGEIVRFVQDGPNSLQNLRWNTRVYCADGWPTRRDADHIRNMLAMGFLELCDPEMPPPRPRRNKDAEALQELRRTMARLEKRT